MIKKILSALIVLIFMVGCSNSVYPADKSTSNVLKSSNNKFVVNNIPLNYMVSIVDYRSKFKNNLLLVSVDIQNHKQKQYDLEYKIQWLDNINFVVDSTPWLPLTLNAMETKSIQEIAHTPQAKSFKFYIRIKQ